MAGPTEHALDLDCLSADAAGPSSDAPQTSMADAPPAERMSLLVRTIERDIIPRLMLAHRNGVAAPAADFAAAAPTHEDVETLVALLIEGDSAGVATQIRRLRERGATAESLLLALLAPAARRLGRMWEEDKCDFTVVTMGLWRLQRAMYDLSPSFQIDAQPPVDGRRILLTAVPGEQHTFGLFMVAEFFRRAGWDVIDAPFEATDELARAVARDWYAVIGVSIACERWLDRLCETVASVRRNSKNLTVSIIAGGPLLLQRPDLQSRIGADAVATDARRAVELAQGMLSVQRLAS